MEWKNIYRGLMMGAIELIPGISSGTIAIILGIYQRLIESINGFFSKEWKRHLKFLIPLGVGMGIAVFSLASLIEWLFISFPKPTQYFFIGLILGVLPFLFHKADVKNTFRTKHVGFVIIGVILVIALGLANAGDPEVITNVTLSTYAFLFFSGIIGSSALLVPGISGSFILLVIGVYPTVISAISNFYFDIIIVTGLGVVVGFVMMSRIIGYFLRNHFTLTFAVAIGLVLGSVLVVFPGWPENISLFIASLATFFGGLLAAYGLGRLEYK